MIHVKKCDFEVFEALAMDLASNANQNSNNSSFVSGSPPGLYPRCPVSLVPDCLRGCVLQASTRKSCRRT